MIKVKVIKERPDFRVFIDLLYGFGHHVNTEGDSYSVISRTWCDLYIKDRQSNDPFVSMYAEPAKELVFYIESASKRLMELSAIYLFLYCGETIEDEQGKFTEDQIYDLMDTYDKEIQRAENSIWHQSSGKNPYPNLDNKT